MTFPWDALCATWLFPLSDCFHLFKCPHGNSINWISEGHMYALLSLCTMEVVGFGSAFPYWDDRVYFSVVRLAIVSKPYKNEMNLNMRNGSGVTNMHLWHAMHSHSSVVQFVSILSAYLRFSLCAAHCTDGLFWFFWAPIDSIVLSVITKILFFCVVFFFFFFLRATIYSQGL